MKSQRRKLNPRRRRRGAVALEFAIVTAIFLLMIGGIVEVGRLIQVHQMLTNSAREGARRAVIPGATDDQVASIVKSYMDSAGIQGYTNTLMVNDKSESLADASSHDRIAFTVSVPYGNVSWGVLRLINPNTTLSSTVVMRKE